MAMTLLEKLLTKGNYTHHDVIPFLSELMSMSTPVNKSVATQLFPQFIKDLNRIQPDYSSTDKVWRLPVRTGDKPKDWTILTVVHYKDVYYVSWTQSNFTLEVDSRGRDREGNHITIDAGKFANAVKFFDHQVSRIEKDWVSVYRQTTKEFPLTLRYGTVPKAILWEYYPTLYRADTELGKQLVREFIAQQRSSRFHEAYSGHHKQMTLAKYMRYSKVAYLANAAHRKWTIEPGQSGLSLYKRFADGRDEGLTKLPPNSAQAFATWYRSGRRGGHPWEIYRGGNTTHIDLGVVERHEGWSVFLGGSSTARMAETIRIAVVLTEANLPVEIPHAEELTLRLLGKDNVGIIPEYLSTHRASQEFDTADKVFDCLHLRDLSRNNRILSFITWKPLAPLRPPVN